jgi:hypothetical protein
MSALLPKATSAVRIGMSSSGTASTVYGPIASGIQRGLIESFTFDARFMQKQPPSSCDCLTSRRE